MIYIKGIYLVFEALNEKLGVKRKIDAQINAMNHFEDVDVTLKVIHSSTKYRKILRRLPYFSAYGHWWKNIDWQVVDFVYLRKPELSSQLVNHFKMIKKTNPKIILLIEIPTYPYDLELSRRWIDWPVVFKEKRTRVKLRGIIHRFVTLSEDDTIFGVKTLKIQNGVEVEKITLKKSSENIKGIINLIGVANVSPWHGYDRVLKGLKLYYESNPMLNLHINIVGDGIALPELRNYVITNQLEHLVTFHGSKSGEELDSLFSNNDIAIGSLANFRHGIFLDSSLKTREYCARGIPFIKSSRDHDFQEVPFVLTIKDDDSPVDFYQVIDFYQSLSFNELPKTMREYALNQLTWDRKILPVINFLKANS